MKAPQASTSDRMASTLFVATFVHGVLILGITFAPPKVESAKNEPTLEVVLVRDAADNTPPEEADYLAQQNQRGHGNTEQQVKPRNELAANPFRSPGTVEGLALKTTRRMIFEASPRVASSRADSSNSVKSSQESREQTAQQTAEARLMVASENVNQLTATSSRDRLAHSNEPRERFISVNTRETKYAGYLVAWKEKIEALGTLHFPDDARRQGMTGNPVLEVAINSDGTVREIIVRRSSKHRLLDRAALRILRLSAPFDPFPDKIGADYDVLRFIYEWQFHGNGQTSGQVVMMPSEQ